MNASSIPGASSAVLGAALGLASTACAVGYGVGYQSASLSDGGNQVLTSDRPAKLATAYQELRIIDSTGLLLAALVNTGRQYNARADAIEAAKYKRPDNDGYVRVEYSYKPMPILSGLLTDLRLRVPLGDPTLEQPVGTKYEMGVEYWGFDVRPEFYTFRPIKSLPLVSSLWLNVEAATWKAPDVNLGFSAFTLDMGFGSSTSYVITEDVTATGRLKVGLLSPLFSALAGGAWFNPSAEVEVGYRPLSTDKFGLMVSGIAGIGRDFELDGRSLSYTRVGLSAAITFGNQIPKKARTQATPSAAGAGTGAQTASNPQTGTLSGFVCLGNDAPPVCKEVVNGVPDAPKLLYTACAQATVTAVNANPPDFSSQPGVCRTAGAGIRAFLETNRDSLDDRTRRLLGVAAATAFDLAGVGYEVSQGRASSDHCAMVEATHGMVIGPDAAKPTLPTRVEVATAAVNQCRAVFTCQRADGEQAMVCTPTTAPAPAPAPAPAE